MVETLAGQIRKVVFNNLSFSVSDCFLERLKTERLTGDKNPESHFCVIFAAYDPKARQVFIGEHKKSGLWLFNGGHIDDSERLEEALKREIREEWGVEIDCDQVGEPELLTVTEIDNPIWQKCKRHFDIWYFVPVDKRIFNPDEDLLAKEFYRNEWLDIEEARKRISNPSSLKALSIIETLFQ